MGIKIIPVDPNTNLATIKPYDANGKMMQPAVTFEANCIAYPDGAKVPNGDIYSTMMEISKGCMGRSLDDLHMGVDSKFVGENFNNISKMNLDIMIDSFLNSLHSHYCVFAAKVNSIVNGLYGDNTPITARKMPLSDDFYYKTHYFRSQMRQFIEKDVDARNIILESNAFTNCCVIGVNTIGMFAYNDAMATISEAIAITDAEHDSDPNDRIIIPFINHIFSSMMADMTYEISAFLHNMKTNHEFVLARKEVLELKYFDDPKNNPTLNPKAMVDYYDRDRNFDDPFN